MLNLVETILNIYHSLQKFNVYHVPNTSVITLLGVVVPVKNIINVCINPVAETFILLAILAIPSTATIERIDPFTVILVQKIYQ